MVLNVQLMVIDPNESFMDEGSLPVAGAHADMRRVAKLVDEKGDRISQIHVTLDTHHVIDIGHPEFWRDQDGKQPQLSATNPAMAIMHDDLVAGLWVPRFANARPPELGGQTVKEYVLGYSHTLEQQGEYPLMVYAEHCLIGSPGWSVQPDLYTALVKWERRRLRNVNYITKGSNPWTEHYGALMANVPLASDPTTGLNMVVLEILRTAEVVGICGEALSHCVMATVNQIAKHIGEEHIKKFHILGDCTSPIQGVPGDPRLDFPAISERWLKEMKSRGMTVTTSEEFLT